MELQNIVPFSLGIRIAQTVDVFTSINMSKDTIALSEMIVNSKKFSWIIKKWHFASF